MRLYSSVFLEIGFGGVQEELIFLGKQIVNQKVGYRTSNICRNRVYLFSVLSFFTAIAIAFFVPTKPTSFFPRVSPV